MAFEGAARTAQTATGLIGILGGLLAAVAAFDGQVRGAVAVFARLGAPGLAASAAALLSLGLLLFVLGRRKAWQLLDPDALRLDPRRPEHLIGRSEDVRLLHEKCVASRLVFLVGDSGAGKSALVRAGLAPAVETSGRLLAVHIDMANLDWDGDACEALADCFWRSLPTAARDALGASQPPAVADLPRLLAACYPTHGRTPLAVLDQIDDYQLRHRERFLPPASRSWIGAAQLIDTNRFWGMLAPLVRARHIHLLMITRSDNADGLESLRLVDNPIVARLDPLPAGFVLRVIDQLVARSSGAAPVVGRGAGRRARRRSSGTRRPAGTGFASASPRTSRLAAPCCRSS
jgi:conflict system STAND superfamily ATPase